jgi:hypothetical protein
MSKPSTLESRIASALTATDITSSDLAQLLIEVEAAAAAADADAAKAREQALDPVTVVDVDKVAAAVASATLTHDRLQAALPRLQDQLKRVRQAEDVAAWRADAEELEQRRLASGAEFRQFYPRMIERIVNHLYDMRALDKKIDHLNSRRPDPSIPALGYITPFFAMDLKIPDPDSDPDNAGAPLLWPPHQPSLAQQMAREMMETPGLFNPPGPGPEWWKTIEERNRLVLAENRKQIAEAEHRQREFEERQRKDLESAKEHDRQAYRERGWPT